jgi:uncharacterized protein
MLIALQRPTPVIAKPFGPTVLYFKGQQAHSSGGINPSSSSEGDTFNYQYKQPTSAQFPDPVYGQIVLDLTQPEDKLLDSIIKTPEFERLNHIKQNGYSYFTARSTRHTRYEHSIGVMENTRKILNRLQSEGLAISPMERQTIIIAGLLHDIGHGPMSHLFEQVSGLHHEDIGKALIQSARTQLQQVLSQAHPTLPRNIVNYMSNPNQPLGSLINGVFDTDRLDYLQRDLISSSLSQPKADQFNAQKLLEGLHFDQSTKQLYFNESLIPELEKFIKTRIYLYQTLSYGKADTSASKMCLLFMTRLRQFLVDKKCTLNQVIPGSAQYLDQLLSREKLLSKDIDLERYVRFDDSSVHELLKNAAMTSTDPVLKHLAHGIIYGNLYRLQALPPNTINKVKAWIKEHGEQLKDPDFPDLVTTASNTLSNYPATTTANNDVIWIKPTNGGPLKPLRELSPYIKQLPTKTTTDYIVYDKSQASLVEPLLKQLLQ